MSLDATNLMLGMLFGSLGAGYLLYAKKAARIVPAFVGMALMAVPWFIMNNIVLLIVCLALSSIPFILRDI